MSNFRLDEAPETMDEVEVSIVDSEQCPSGAGASTSRKRTLTCNSHGTSYPARATHTMPLLRHWETESTVASSTPRANARIRPASGVSGS